MKYFVFAILLCSCNLAMAQKGLKLASVEGKKITPLSANYITQTYFKAGSGLKSKTSPKLVSRGKSSYVQMQVENSKGSSVNVAFEINRSTGFTTNFRFVCKGDCSQGGTCGFTYDNSGKIDGCSCCSLDIERIPSTKITASDLGL